LAAIISSDLSMRLSIDDLDMTAFVMFAVFLASLTSAQMSYRQTYSIDPFAHNPFILLSMIAILIVNLFLINRKIRVGLLAGYAFFFGVYERTLHVLDFTFYSDVLLVSKEAVQVMLSGGNVYTHIFRSSVPPGQPFKYGPFEPVFYVPFYLFSGDLRVAELFSAVLVMILILLLGKFSGYDKTLIPLALYSSWGSIITSTGAGVNDDSAALLGFLPIFLLILAMKRRSRKLAWLSSIALGISICFKLFSALFTPFIIILLFNLGRKSPIDWKQYLTLVVATVFGLSLPYLLVSPEAYLRNIFIANVDRLVEFQYQWHIWNSFLSKGFFAYLPGLFNVEVNTMMFMIPKIMLAVSSATFILLLAASWKVTSLARIISYGIVAWFILLMTGPWFPSSFLGFIAPFVCALPILDLAWKS